MRPLQETSVALLAAVAELSTPERSPTVREMAEHAGVGVEAATNSVKNLSRAGRLRPVRSRKVAYRSKPVAEWALPLEHDDHRAGHGWVDLGRIVGGWAR